jgi:hypothetical protein
MKRPKQIAEKHIELAGQSQRVRVIAPAAIAEPVHVIASRNDANAPGQKFMRQQRG